MTPSVIGGHPWGVGSTGGPTITIILGELMNDLVTYLRIQLAAKAKNEKGASAVEYGLLVALIAVIIIVAVSALGHTLSSVFDNTSTKVGSAS
jgi:pilus assembly protein Flp/PilA